MIAAFKLVPFPLTIALLLTASTFAQTVLWDFETPGEPPPDWTPGWNPEPCFPCDTQHGYWKAEDGVLVPPAYPLDSGKMDSFVLSPVFPDASPVISQASGSGGPILTFSLTYDESKLVNAGNRIGDLLQILLLTVGSTEFSTLFSEPLNNAGPWRDRDEMDNPSGIIDGVIMVEEPLEEGVQYRLRVRAVDTDFDVTTFAGVFDIDNIAITNEVIPGNADFDDDGDVDGRDFLVWQRNPSVGNLSDWQANYGAGPLVASSISVPEPATLSLLMLATAVGWVGRQTARTVSKLIRM